MATYKVVDMEHFDRSDYFHYFMSVGTMIEFTVKVDVTTAVKTCKSESVNFQSYILYKLYKAINRIEKLRMDIMYRYSLRNCKRNWMGWMRYIYKR